METKLYREMYQQEKRHWWFVGRRKIIHSFLQQCIHTPRASALDVGCGTGFNLELLREFSNDVQGLEPSSEVVSFLQQERADFPIIHGTFPEDAMSKTYDIVTLLDVLEHIDDDEAALKKIEKLLAPDGIALITVPALSFLWTEHDTLHHHKRRYTKKELIEKIGRSTHLEIEQISYMNFLLAPMIMAIRMIKKILHARPDKSDLFAVSAIPNAILIGIFSFELHILRFINFPFGISLICVLRKK
ncbi:MAG: class I SAM-dependent methyltransferase [Patescibacteria group bacterium]